VNLCKNVNSPMQREIPRGMDGIAEEFPLAIGYRRAKPRTNVDIGPAATSPANYSSLGQPARKAPLSGDSAPPIFKAPTKNRGDRVAYKFADTESNGGLQEKHHPVSINCVLRACPGLGLGGRCGDWRGKLWKISPSQNFTMARTARGNAPRGCSCGSATRPAGAGPPKGTAWLGKLAGEGSHSAKTQGQFGEAGLPEIWLRINWRHRGTHRGH